MEKKNPPHARTAESADAARTDRGITLVGSGKELKNEHLQTLR